MKNVAQGPSRVKRLPLAPLPRVELAFCIGSESLRLHGVRLATWRGIGRGSILIVCDECHSERLTNEERQHMVEVSGAARVRQLGLHELHDGRFPAKEGAAR